jgi:outer membrane protein assembly factor BamB
MLTLAIALALHQADLKEAWSAGFDDEVVAAPQTDGKTVYAVSTAGVVRALKLEDGSKVWEFAAKPSRLPLVLQKNRVVVAQDDGTVLGLDAATGEKTFELAGVAGAVPTKGKDRVYLAGRYGRRGNTNTVSTHKTVTCVDVEKGKAAWTVDLKIPVGPATESGDRVYAGGIACLDAKTGKLAWTSDVQLGQAVVAPAATKDRVLAQDMMRGTILCVDAKTGKKAWTYEPKGAIQAGLIPLTVADGRVYAASLPELACLDVAKGGAVWTAKLAGYSSFSAGGPAVSEGLAFVVYDGRLGWVDIAKGALAGSKELGDAGNQPQPTPVEGGVLVAAGSKVLMLKK